MSRNRLQTRRNRRKAWDLAGGALLTLAIISIPAMLALLISHGHNSSDDVPMVLLPALLLILLAIACLEVAGD